MIAFSPAALALLEKGAYIRRALIKADLGNGVEGVWNDDYDIDFESVTYKGLLNFAISPIVGTADGTVEGITITFSGLDQAALDLVNGGDWHQQPISIRRLYIDPVSKAILGIKPEFYGRLDLVKYLTAGDGTATLEVACESWDRDLERVVGGQRTSGNQAQINPVDKFFEYVGPTAQEPITWGR